MQMEHVSLGVSSGRQAVREAIKKFTENDEVRGEHGSDWGEGTQSAWTAPHN